MGKKQIDSFGNPFSLKKFQVDENIRRKQLESLFSKGELEPFLGEIKQEDNIIEWQVKKLQIIIGSLNSALEEKNQNINKKQILDNVSKSLNKLQKIHKDKDFLRIFGKVFHRYKDLFEFSLNNSSSLVIQFYRIVSFLEIIVDMIEPIVFMRETLSENVRSKTAYYPSDEEELYNSYDEYEEIILSALTFRIVDDQIRISVGDYKQRTRLPLKFDNSMPSSLKNKYYPSPDHVIVRLREKIKKLPEFFAKILLEDEDRIKFKNMLLLDTIKTLDLSNLNLEILPKEIGLFSTLEELNLSGNQLRELPESLRQLKSLKNLNLYGNPLGFLPEALYILLARRVDIIMPKDIQFEKLEPKRLIDLANKINEEKKPPEYFVICNGMICFTKNKRLLDLSNKGITNINSIYGLEEIDGLTTLNLSLNKIEKIEGLEKHKSLKYLDLSRNNIKQISGLEMLVNLVNLRLSKNRIYSIKGLDSLINLKKLFLDNNHISKIEDLDSLENLRALNLDDNRNIDELWGLENLINLRDLNLDGNKIKELKGLNTLVNLKSISLKKHVPQSNITDVKGLEQLVKLEKFDTSFFPFYVEHHPSEHGKLVDEFRNDGRQWVNYCRKKKNLEIL